MMFLHGLATNRNTYSYLAGSLASHGLVVVCPEHRDGSAIISFVRTPKHGLDPLLPLPTVEIPYGNHPYFASAEFYRAREAQLQIRFWEIGLIHDALLKLDHGVQITNLNPGPSSLTNLQGKLHVHKPGSIIFSGHSFGATTACQFVKSVYYADAIKHSRMHAALYTPDRDSKIRRQITESTITVFLDMWSLPLLGPTSKGIYDLPLPAHASPGGGSHRILAIGSDEYQRWDDNLAATAHLISPGQHRIMSESCYAQRRSRTETIDLPTFVYCPSAMHASQSDFLIVFPWLRKPRFSCSNSRKILHMNLRAILSHLRANHVPLSRHRTGDHIGAELPSTSVQSVAEKSVSARFNEPLPEKHHHHTTASGTTLIDCWVKSDCLDRSA